MYSFVQALVNNGGTSYLMGEVAPSGISLTRAMYLWPPQLKHSNHCFQVLQFHVAQSVTCKTLTHSNTSMFSSQISSCSCGRKNQKPLNLDIAINNIDSGAFCSPVVTSTSQWNNYTCRRRMQLINADGRSVSLAGTAEANVCSGNLHAQHFFVVLNELLSLQLSLANVDT